MTAPTDEQVIWEIPAETKEWIGPLHQFVNDIEQTTGVKYALVPLGARPGTTFTDPLDIGGLKGLMVGPTTNFPLVAGESYRIWGTFTTGTEAPVLNDIGTVIAV